jgi:protein-S-isoprenylcysteine O-methyltransferase Ste14
MSPSDTVWLAFALVWAAGSFRNKGTIRRLPVWWVVGHCLALTVAFSLAFLHALRVGPLAWRVLPDSDFAEWTGEATQISGLAFSIWARLHLGRNWSGMGMVKEDHELVRSGPYAIVRHPIYSGLLLAILGKAIDHGNVAGFLGFAILLEEWNRKAVVEERFMTEQFGDEYARYCRKVKRLIPGVL